MRMVTYSNLAFIVSRSVPLEMYIDHKQNEKETTAFTSITNDVYKRGEHIFTNDLNTGRV